MNKKLVGAGITLAIFIASLTVISIFSNTEDISLTISPDAIVAKGLDMASTYKIQYLDTKYVFDKDGVILFSIQKMAGFKDISKITFNIDDVNKQDGV